MLDGKKVIFIGNSYTYYGDAVLEKKQSFLTQEARMDDEGYFYQICKSNGAEVSVTNWTFGGHTLDDLFGGNCSADRGCDGVDHASYLQDLNYDYVMIQNGSGSAEKTDALEFCQPIMELFRKSNPDVKFVYLVHHSVHSNNYAWRSSLNKLAQEGVTVVDWGAIVNDVITGATEVPGATMEYNKNSFVVCKSEKDGYHPNMLTGYITSLMTYCAITGKSAVGQDYSFAEVNHSFSYAKAKHYTYQNPVTNFDQIFKSKSDMKGIQKLIDTYLEEKGYQEY